MLRAGYYGCIATNSFDLAAGTASYALPADFVEARLVERILPGGTVPLDYNERYDTPNRTTGTTVNSSAYYLPSYHFEGANIVLEQTPQETTTGLTGIKLTYWKIPVRLVSDSDTPDAAFKDLWHDMLVLYCAKGAKEKEELKGMGGVDFQITGTLARLEQSFKESINVPTAQRQTVQPYGLVGW